MLLLKVFMAIADIAINASNCEKRRKIEIGAKKTPKRVTNGIEIIPTKNVTCPQDGEKRILSSIENISKDITGKRSKVDWVILECPS
jgi:hypothetical protein